MINDKVKLNKKDYHPCCKSYLAEVSRKNMVGKSKKQSPERYAKKSNYHALKYDGIDVNKLLTDDQFVVVVPVGKYECTIAFNGVIEELGTMLKMQKHGNEYSANINLQMCIRVLQRTIDNKDILVDCSCPDFCLEENTKIKLLNGKVYTVKELLQMHENNEEIWVYSTDENGDFKPGKVTDVWVSGYSDKMLKVTLDNGESIITTPNHKYMMRDCSYKTAEELQVGDSLMPLYFNEKSGYETVKLNTKAKSWVSVYKTVANTILLDEIEEAKVRSGEDIIAIHHSDFNKSNNYPSNLKPLGVLEHWNYHANLAMEDKERFEKFIKAGREYWDSEEGRKRKSEEMSRSIKNFWANMTEEEKREHIQKSRQWANTEEYREKLSTRMKNYWANLDEETYAKRCKENGIILNGLNGEKSAQRKRDWWANATPEQREHRKQAYLETIKDRPVVTTEKKRKANSITLKKTVTELYTKQAEEVINRLISNNLIVNEENYNAVRKKGEPLYKTAVKYGLIEKYNHKVVAIEYITYENPIPLYDLTVDKYNNFYVDAGVVLHNCYRFAFFATKFGYKYGKPETRPSKITNPHDDKGSVCKHLLALLSSKRWLVKLATTFNTIVHDHLYEIQDMLGMWDEDAFVNRSGVHSRTTVNRMRQANAQQKSFDKPMVVDMSDDLDLGESVEETTSKERMLR